VFSGDGSYVVHTFERDEGRIKWRLMLSDYTPMAPTLVRAPFHRDGWVFEEKVDGWLAQLPTLSHFKRSTAIACARVTDITRGCL